MPDFNTATECRARGLFLFCPAKRFHNAMALLRGGFCLSLGLELFPRNNSRLFAYAFELSCPFSNQA